MLSRKITPIICYVAAQSGGHLIPCLTHAKKEQATGKKITLFTGRSSLENNIIQNNNIDQVIRVSFVQIPGKKFWRYPVALISLVSSFIKSLFYFMRNKPCKIISMGGVISIPVCLAAKCAGIPIELYELNVEPGKAIFFLSRITRHVFVCFEETKQYFPRTKCTTTDYPIRYTADALNISQEQALTHLQLDCSRTTLFVLGGSQGSLFINRLIQQWIENNLNQHSIQIIHQIGATDTFNWKNFYQQQNIPAIVFDFDNNLLPYYQAADIIICRSGAGTLAESMFFGEKCITIPLITPSTYHQIFNAQAYQNKYPHLITVVKQADLGQTTKAFAQAINHLITNTNLSNYTSNETAPLTFDESTS